MSKNLRRSFEATYTQTETETEEEGKQGPDRLRGPWFSGLSAGSDAWTGGLIE
jgi:hypothetical protein